MVRFDVLSELTQLVSRTKIQIWFIRLHQSLCYFLNVSRFVFFLPFLPSFLFLEHSAICVWPAAVHKDPGRMDSVQ